MPLAASARLAVVLPDPATSADNNAWGGINNTAVQKLDKNAEKFSIVAEGAVAGGAAGTSKAACVAARARAIANGGGTVYVPAGVFDAGDWACDLYGGVGVTVNLAGDGHCSVLKFSTDRGLGTVAVEVSADPTFRPLVRNIALRGPGYGAARPSPLTGSSPANMDGVRAKYHAKLDHVDLQGWRSGFRVAGDHVTFKAVKANNNLYGCYYGADLATAGDGTFNDCDLTGNWKASIGIYTGATAGGSATPYPIMGSTTFNQCHFGFGPFGIFIESGGSGSDYPLQDVRFIGTSFEYLGNAAIYSEGKTAGAIRIYLYNCGNFTDGTASGYAIPSLGKQADLYMKEVSGITIHGPAFIPRAASNAAIDLTILNDLEWMNWKASFLYARDTAVKPWILADIAGIYGGSGGVLVRGRERHLLYTVYPAATVTAGELAKLVGGDIVPYSGGAGFGAGGVCPGVSYNTAIAANREVAVIAERDENMNVKTTAGSAAIGDVLTGDATTRQKVAVLADGTARLSGRPIIGSAMGTVASGLVPTNVWVSQ